MSMDPRSVNECGRPKALGNLTKHIPYSRVNSTLTRYQANPRRIRGRRSQRRKRSRRGVMMKRIRYDTTCFVPQVDQGRYQRFMNLWWCESKTNTIRRTAYEYVCRSQYYTRTQVMVYTSIIKNNDTYRTISQQLGVTSNSRGSAECRAVDEINQTTRTVLNTTLLYVQQPTAHILVVLCCRTSGQTIANVKLRASSAPLLKLFGSCVLYV